MYYGFPSPCTLYLSCFFLGLHYLGMTMSVLHFCTLLCHTLRMLAMSVYYPALCDSIMHDACIYIYIYIYICLHVCVWLCTLYDGTSWLHKRPYIAISALDLVAWVCAQGICCMCIFISYCVHSHCSVTVSIHDTKSHRFPCVCDMYQWA